MPLPDFSNPSLSPDPQGLQKIAPLAKSFTPVRPLDPNGVDVPAELPVLQRAYTHALGASHRIKGAEAGYAMFHSDPGYGHTGFVTGDEYRDRIPTPPGTFAVAHTHPPGTPATPGPQDANMDVPNYIYNGNRLLVTVPHTKQYHEYPIAQWNSPLATIGAGGVVGSGGGSGLAGIAPKPLGREK